jgi:hypothetical protein
VATERGAKHIIMDVSNLSLNDNEKLEFIYAIADFYDSNFWITFKSVGILIWLTALTLLTFKAYFTLGKLENPKNHWLSRLFLMLELTDLGKDLIYLYGRRHTLLVSLLFSQTFIIPFVMNVWGTNTVEFRIG